METYSKAASTRKHGCALCLLETTREILVSTGRQCSNRGLDIQSGGAVEYRGVVKCDGTRRTRTTLQASSTVRMNDTRQSPVVNGREFECNQNDDNGREDGLVVICENLRAECSDA